MYRPHIFQQTVDKAGSVGDTTSFGIGRDWSSQANAGPAAVGGVTIAAIQPAPHAAPLTQILYLAETTGQAAISVTDINQGQMGDCFLLSSIGEIALLKPAFIANMIHVNANGTETVTLYGTSTGQSASWYTPTAALTPIGETITNTFATNSVDSGATQDVSNGQKEIWPQVIEKAYAQLNGGYAAISNGGSPLVAMDALTGHASSYLSPTVMPVASLLASLLADQTAGDMMVFDTKSSGALTNGLVNNHAYMFQSVTGGGSSAVVHLLNPWGFDQPSAISVSTLGKSIVEIDVNHV